MLSEIQNAMRLFLGLLAVSVTALQICPAQTEQSITGKSASGKIDWEIRPPADNRSQSTIWLWPNGQKDKIAQLGDADYASPQNIVFSADDAWIVVTRHLSSGNYFSFYRRESDGRYTEDKSAEDPFEKGEIEKAATSEEIDRSSFTFVQWADGFGPYGFIFALSARLSRRGPDSFFMQFGGWRGVFDLQKRAVVKMLEPGKVRTASETWEEALNEDYRKLRDLLDETGRENLKTEERAWLKKRDSIKSAQERAEFTGARVNELENKISNLKK
jgi:hypothetical protein